VVVFGGDGRISFTHSPPHCRIMKAGTAAVSGQARKCSQQELALVRLRDQSDSTVIPVSPLQGGCNSIPTSVYRI